MRISDWSSDVCSSDLSPLLRRARLRAAELDGHAGQVRALRIGRVAGNRQLLDQLFDFEGGQLAAPSAARSEGHQQQRPVAQGRRRSEEHTSELQSLMRISYAVFCLKKKNNRHTTTKQTAHNAKN